MSSLIGKNVVVRSSPSGVWMGELVAQDGAVVTLRDARRAWNWDGAASCSGLAVRGPRGGKICEPVPTAEIHDCCEILEASEAAIAAWKAVTPWVA